MEFKNLRSHMSFIHKPQMHQSRFSLIRIYPINTLSIKLPNLLISFCQGSNRLPRTSRHEFDIPKALVIAEVAQELRRVFE